MQCLTFEKPPLNFNSTVEISSCFCEWRNTILLLKRHPERPQGNTWGLPAGKMEKGETPRMTVIREIEEEVGLKIDDPTLEAIGKFYCRLPHVDYIHHLFRKPFNQYPKVVLQLEESLEMQWVTVDQALHWPLIAGGVEVLNYYKRFLCKMK